MSETGNYLGFEINHTMKLSQLAKMSKVAMKGKSYLIYLFNKYKLILMTWGSNSVSFIARPYPLILDSILMKVKSSKQYYLNTFGKCLNPHLLSPTHFKESACISEVTQCLRLQCCSASMQCSLGKGKKITQIKPRPPRKDFKKEDYI